METRFSNHLGLSKLVRIHYRLRLIYQKSKLQCLSTGKEKLRSVAELSGILKNRGFKKSAFTVVSKKLCGAAAVDPVRIETKNVDRRVA